MKKATRPSCHKSRRVAGIQSHTRPVPKHEIRPFKAETSKHKKKISPARDLTKVILRAHAPSSPVTSSKPGAASPPSTGSFPSGPSEHIGRRHADFRSARMRSEQPSLREFPYLTELRPRSHDPEQRPVQERTVTRRQLAPFLSRLGDELISLERRDDRQHKPALRLEKSESAPET
ncbi:hypothetical protein DY000_02041512 [Brassica cretica]|uniref:Uncharacterized protein n=1 Tax=Brassica cretica TaxID=69181 RepID=A0ABQ7B4U3_BRACR|nr:hypothetical protein DY000_02041512 [Brassica cretica]